MLYILGIAAYLFIKHYVVDFLLQSKEMAEKKGIYGNRAGILHASLHILFSAPLVIIFWPNAFPLILEAITHYHIDWFKIWYNKNRGWHSQTKEFWYSLGLDQLLHYTVYLIMIGWWLL